MKLSDYEYYRTDLGVVYKGSCLDILPLIDIKFNAIIVDLPYGTTACSWDTVIDLQDLWKHYKRLRNDNTPIVLFGSQPFTTDLINSNRKEFKYEIIWYKTKPQRHVLAKKMPMTIFENISVFYFKQSTYNPIMRKGKPYIKKHGNNSTCGVGLKRDKRNNTITINNGERYPLNLIKFSNNNNNNYHSCQKPVELIQYLVKTYTNENDIILDNTAGSGTLGLACERLNRRYILIEQEEKYCKIIKKRLKQESDQFKMFRNN